MIFPVNLNLINRPDLSALELRYDSPGQKDWWCNYINRIIIPMSEYRPDNGMFAGAQICKTNAT